MELRWGIPYQIKIGTAKQWRRECCIPNDTVEGFFQFWNTHKIKMLADGFGVFKNSKNKKWYVTETKDHVALFKEVGTPPKSKNEIRPELTIPPHSLKISSGLRPWQVESAQRLVSILNHYGSAIDGSEMGTGKTFTSCGVVREMDRPFVIVCPKPVINQWQKVINNHFGLNANNLGIINYELLIRGRKDSKIASFVLLTSINYIESISPFFTYICYQEIF